MIRRADHPLTQLIRARLDERRADILRPFTRVIDWADLRPDDAPDLVTAALTLTQPDLEAKLKALYTVLAQGGLFLGATFGAGTLADWRACLIEAECTLSGGAADRLPPFPDAQDIARWMQNAGFALPVIDTETVQIDAETLPEILRTLRPFRTVRPTPFHPAPRSLWAQTEALYRARYGKPSARVEIVYLHGWKETAPRSC